MTRLVRAVAAKVRSEPALIAGGVQAAIALVAAFGVHLTAEQVGAVEAFTAAVLSIIVRSQVSPTAGV